MSVEGDRRNAAHVRQIFEGKKEVEPEHFKEKIDSPPALLFPYDYQIKESQSQF
jgi:hypothetical protein